MLLTYRTQIHTLKMLCVYCSEALFDHDEITGAAVSPGYLKRSAALLRSCVKPAPPPGKMDKYIRLLLDVDGPRYVHENILLKHNEARRVGYTFYTLAFAELVFRQALSSFGRVKTLRSRLVAKAVEDVNQLWHLLPTHGEQWLAILEDIWSSPFVKNFRVSHE